MPDYVDDFDLNGNLVNIISANGEGYYPGIDLTAKFATEIAGYTDEWAWILARITNGNFSKLHVGDYIPVTCTNGNSFNARIAGINTYKGTGDSAVGNHIDFISASLWPTAVKMNLIDTNNGTGANAQYTWLASNAYLYLNSLSGSVPGGTNSSPTSQSVDYTSGGVYGVMPTKLQSVIVDKYIPLPKRYSASGKVLHDNGWGWANAGKVWIPSEVELTGASAWGGGKYGAAGFVQYPLFVYGGLNRVSSGTAFWTMTAADGNATHFVAVNGKSAGNVAYTAASSNLYSFICFRVAASNATGSGNTMSTTEMPDDTPTALSYANGVLTITV